VGAFISVVEVHVWCVFMLPHLVIMLTYLVIPEGFLLPSWTARVRGSDSCLHCLEVRVLCCLTTLNASFP